MPQTRRDSSLQDRDRKGCSTYFDIGYTRPCRPGYFISTGSGIEVDFTYLFQRHSGMDLIDVDCELILNALNLTIKVRGDH